ncbi:hypothetical protein EX30DRAFT_337605 [Ascodesmis nigricans]|uniref:DnaJ homologue subfamily C member 28 conserved domain-containing protein n=1 Tax=Ascodesmis nigricans TaxID=341454 RepID=A0A4S2N7F3_9PEZI|nr:hypothetical protein EX30DRAFT_337605 [Ascodesmis nigricans]
MPLIRPPLFAALQRCTVQSARHSSSKTSDNAPPPLSTHLDGQNPKKAESDSNGNDNEPPDSALKRRFESLSESASLSSPTRAHHAAADPANAPGFSEELKEALSHRLSSADFSNQHAQAISVSKMPSSAPKHARDVAAAPAWTGTESTEDAVLRMLVDAHKPLKPELRGGLKQPPTLSKIPVDLRPKGMMAGKLPGSVRVGRAKEAAVDYAAGKGLTEEEKDEVKQMLRERFMPEGRSGVATVQALMSLAEQRIEDAIARGQFKDLPRGKPLERDYNASSPFLDTTTYYLNKMIQKQEILPPWVEKQQELTKSTHTFRLRLHRDWLRFVSRLIASQGGTLDQQIAKAEEYAKAEKRRVKLEAITAKLSRSEELTSEEQEWYDADLSSPGPTRLFRDPDWEKQEESFNNLSIKDINDLTRSYNLMAPELARKPYLTLERELKRCFASVAPEVAGELRRRAEKGINWEEDGGKAKEKAKKRGLLESVEVLEDERPQFGFRELWKQWFRKK